MTSRGEHTHSRGRGPLVTVRVLKAPGTGEVQASRQRRQNHLGDGIAAANGVFEDLQVAAVLDGRRDLGAVALDLVPRHLEHLVAVLGAGSDAGAAAHGLVAGLGRDWSESCVIDCPGLSRGRAGGAEGHNTPQMRGDEAKLVLGLEGRGEEALHQLERLLVVGEHSAAVDALEVEVKVALLQAGVDHLVDLAGVLGEQEPVVDGLHGPHGHLLAHPVNGLRGVKDGSHDADFYDPRHGIITSTGGWEWMDWDLDARAGQEDVSIIYTYLEVGTRGGSRQSSWLSRTWN